MKWSASLPLLANVTSFAPGFSAPEICHLNLSLAGAAAVTVTGVFGRLPDWPELTLISLYGGGPPGPGPPASATTYLPAVRLRLALWLAPGGTPPSPPSACSHDGVLFDWEPITFRASCALWPPVMRTSCAACGRLPSLRRVRSTRPPLTLLGALYFAVLPCSLMLSESEDAPPDELDDPELDELELLSSLPHAASASADAATSATASDRAGVEPDVTWDPLVESTRRAFATARRRPLERLL